MGLFGTGTITERPTRCTPIGFHGFDESVHQEVESIQTLCVADWTAYCDIHVCGVFMMRGASHRRAFIRRGLFRARHPELPAGASLEPQFRFSPTWLVTRRPSCPLAASLSALYCAPLGAGTHRGPRQPNALAWESYHLWIPAPLHPNCTHYGFGGPTCPKLAACTFRLQTFNFAPNPLGFYPDVTFKNIQSRILFYK